MVVSCALIAVARGEYRDPTIQVNVNEQTSLFEDSLEGADQDWGSLQEKLEQGKRSALSDIESKKNLGSITSKSEGELKNSAASLSSIDAIDLNSRGSEEFAKGTLMQDIYVDFSKPLNQQSMKDAKKIAKAQDKLMGNLLGKLKEIGVDCKTVKGPKKMEPAYYLQLEKSQHKDTKYNQKLCEELRSKYNCADSLGLKCKKRGMKWEDWEQKTIEIGGAELVANAKWVFYGRKLKQKHFRLYVDNRKMRSAGFFSNKLKPNPNFEGVKRYFQQLIASKLNASIEQVSTDDFGVENLDHYVNPYRPAWGGVGCPGLRKKEWIYPTYRIHYKFREGNEICEEWQENWTERCRIE